VRGAVHLQVTQVAPIDLRLFAWRRLEAAHRSGICGAPLRMQPILQDRVATAIAALADLPQQHLRVPHPRFQAVRQEGLVWIQLAGLRHSRTVARHPFRIQQVFAHRPAVVARQFADRRHAQAHLLHLFHFVHVFSP